MGYMWIQAAWGHSRMWTTVNASRVHISSSRPTSDFSYNSDTQLLVTSDSTSAPLLVISSKHHTSFSCFQESTPQITCTQVYPLLCLPEKADWSKHFSSTSTLHGHHYCCCCCYCFLCLHPDPAAKSVLHHCFHFLPSLLQKQATEDQQFYCPWKACAQATRLPQINHLLEVFF